jgi:hypothetical protein
MSAKRPSQTVFENGTKSRLCSTNLRFLERLLSDLPSGSLDIMTSPPDTATLVTF